MSERLIHFVPFDCAGVLDTCEGAPDQGLTQADGAPVAALNFSGRPDDERLHLRLSELNSTSGVLAEASLWVPLDEEAIDIAHAGHPLVQFTVYPAEADGPPPTEALGFVVCAQCHDQFLQHVTTSEHIGVGPCAPAGTPEEDLNDFTPHLVIAELDPGHVAWVELQAWRYAYTVARAQQA